MIRLFVFWCLSFVLLSPAPAQSFFRKLLGNSVAQPAPEPEVTGPQSYAGYIFSDGRDTLVQFDSTRTDLAYRMAYTPRKELARLMAPYLVQDICMPGDTLNPVYLGCIRMSGVYADSMRQRLMRDFGAGGSLRSQLPLLKSAEALRNCEFRFFPFYARTFNMVQYNHEDDQLFTRFYHLISEEYRYVLFHKGKPAGYAVYIPGRPELSGVAPVAPGDSVVLSRFPARYRMVAVSPYVFRPGSYLPKSMGFGFLEQGRFMLLQGQGGYLTISATKGKVKRVKIQEQWLATTPKVSILSSLAQGYRSVPGLPNPELLGPGLRIPALAPPR
jgi:hypothetical protein